VRADGVWLRIVFNGKPWYGGVNPLASPTKVLACCYDNSILAVHYNILMKRPIEIQRRWFNCYIHPLRLLFFPLPLHYSRIDVAQEPWRGHACNGLVRNKWHYSSFVSTHLSARFISARQRTTPSTPKIEFYIA
jgi:hypothetical protein